MGFHKSRCKAVTQTDLTSPLHQKQGEGAAWLLREHTSMESPHCAWGAESWCVPPLHVCVHVRVCTRLCVYTSVCVRRTAQAEQLHLIFLSPSKAPRLEMAQTS